MNIRAIDEPDAGDMPQQEIALNSTFRFIAQLQHGISQERPRTDNSQRGTVHFSNATLRLMAASFMENARGDGNKPDPRVSLLNVMLREEQPSGPDSAP